MRKEHLIRCRQEIINPERNKEISNDVPYHRTTNNSPVNAFKSTLPLTQRKNIKDSETPITMSDPNNITFFNPKSTVLPPVGGKNSNS